MWLQWMYFTVGLCSLSFYGKHKLLSSDKEENNQKSNVHSNESNPPVDDGTDRGSKVFESKTTLKDLQFQNFQKSYLLVAILAMFSDWLQGPYGYALYSSYGYSQGAIARLYMVGFLSSMVAGSIVGSLADRYGRKKFCILYSIFYIISCLVKLQSGYFLLMVGRFFAGIATSLLFSAFESWMVAEHFKRGGSESKLGETFTYLTLGNGISAVVAGLVANKAVDSFGVVGPFVVACLPLTIVGILVFVTWQENYGDQSKEGGDFAIQKSWEFVKENPHIFNLGMAQSCFEGAMYTFVFVWTPVLVDLSRDENDSANANLGVIFATFMVWVMIGSNIFNVLNHRGYILSTPKYIHGVATLCQVVCVLFPSNINLVYISFLFFEGTVGMFYPTYGTIKSNQIPDSIRSGVMNLFRVPLNAIMVIVLGLVEIYEMPTYNTIVLCLLIHGAGYYFYGRFYELALKAQEISKNKGVEMMQQEKSLLTVDNV